MTRPGDDLVWRAGPRALEHIRRRGLVPTDIRVVVFPATGPRWIALAALDHALQSGGWMAPARGNPRRILVGASAGAWRALALACPDAETVHRELLDAYIAQVFPSGVRPDEVSSRYRTMLRGIFTRKRVNLLTGRPDLGAVVLTVRARWPVRSTRPRVQWTGLAICAAGNWMSSRLPDALLTPVAVAAQADDVPAGFPGDVARLDPDNATDVALASGTLPIVMDPVVDPPSLPPGHYLDGGLLDYHLRRRWASPGHGLTLLLHVGGPIRPGWFDRWRPSRRPPARVLDDLVVLEPSARFLGRLPDRRLPDRQDFYRFADDPSRRLRRWREAVAAGDDLAEAFARGATPETIERDVRPLDDGAAA